LENHIHIIAFDIPSPPNYGGVIDVFYRIKALHEIGVKIHLHNFVYGSRKESKELEKYCEKVFYYPRKKWVFDLMNPYIVSSRSNESLLTNLAKDNAPIFFEALHSCYFLDHPKLKNRVKMVRMHNIEHDYYKLLAEAEPNIIKKIYFTFESILLHRFERKLAHASLIFTISSKDEAQLKQSFGAKVKLLPAFHGNSKVESKLGIGNYCLYHGKLSVAENHQAAMYLVQEVFSKIDIPLIIAGDGIQASLQQAANAYNHIQLMEGLNPEEIDDLILNAHINVLPTFQPTGIKLKLVNVLYKGRFLVVNKAMVAETGVEEACIIADNPQKMADEIKNLMTKSFSAEDLTKRQRVLGQQFDVIRNAQSLLAEINLLP
jgi:hypothetical protein